MNRGYVDAILIIKQSLMRKSTIIYFLFIFSIENSYDEESWNQKSWEDLILKVGFIDNCACW